MKAKYRKGFLVSVAIVTMTIGVLFTVGFNRLFGPLDSFPRLYKMAKCPDGSHTAVLYRRKTSWLCPAECIEVIVEVQDSRGGVVQGERVTSLDVWGDMDFRYPELRCNEDAVSIGGGRDGLSYEIRRRK